MNGFELAGRGIRVGLGNDKSAPESNTQRTPGPQSSSQSHYQGSSFSGQGGRGVQAGGSNNFDRAGGRENEKGGGASALDDTDVAGVNFNNYSRDSLMRKLARTDDSQPSVDDQQKTLRSKTETKPLPVNVNAVGRFVKLSNMFDPAEYVSLPIPHYHAMTNPILEKPAKTGSRNWRKTFAQSASANMATLFTSR